MTNHANIAPGAHDQHNKAAGRTPDVAWGTPTVVAATATKVLDARPGRIGFQLQNVGSGDIFVGFDDTVSTTKYAFKLTDGAVMFMYLGEGLLTSAIWAIVDSSTIALANFEIY